MSEPDDPSIHTSATAFLKPIAGTLQAAGVRSSRPRHSSRPDDAQALRSKVTYSCGLWRPTFTPYATCAQATWPNLHLLTHAPGFGTLPSRKKVYFCGTRGLPYATFKGM